MIGALLVKVFASGISAKQQVIQGLESLGSRLLRVVDVKLCRAVVECLLAFRLRGGQDNDLVAHGGGELDGQVAQAADAHDADAVGGLDFRTGEDGEDGGAGAEQGRGVGGVVAVGDGEDHVGGPDDAGGDCAHLVVVAVEV